MLSDVQKSEVSALHSQGVSERRIAKCTGLSRGSVRRVLRPSLVRDYDNKYWSMKARLAGTAGVNGDRG